MKRTNATVCFCLECRKKFLGRNAYQLFCGTDCRKQYDKNVRASNSAEREAKRDQCAKTIGRPVHYLRGGRQSVDCGLEEDQ